jgi:hypothetical protein
MALRRFSRRLRSLSSNIPFLKGNVVEQRQWTVRRRTHISPLPIHSFFPTPLLVSPSPAAFASPDPPTPCPPFLAGADPLSDFAFDDGEDVAYNFIKDPCCCCPCQWTQEDRNAEDLFKFA